ncbi:hypothetical protein [Brevibacillus laterosporus]|uniref:Lipoprotein n=1 Tax=Brevibacillus laterosporus TaxID=1465 RepID=A0AAP3DJD6_BRELA|nr:hypothetical protein [Brevibacillus laterosporus]MCR8982028.1 hypothetical protein [Brevibacillus laterosporus]MCZ0809183.1 hypothetical protein [Brevibacillus laterosporus]MCZ0852346.1 hypothetical protein [Brevibacillus laterosporus]
MLNHERLPKRMIVLPIIGILLAGCGNGVQATPDSEKTDQIVNSSITATVSEENKSNDQSSKTLQPSTNQNSSNPASSKGQPPAQTKELTYTIEGKQVSEQGQLFESHLGYYLYYLPDFKATGEEPGKDMLFSEKNDRYAVRIEQMPDKIDLTAQKKLMEVELSDLGNVQNLKKEQETDPFLQKTALHLGVDTKNDHKEIIVTKIDKRWFRFTLFAPKEKENAVILPQLLAMLKTIMVKK